MVITYSVILIGLLFLIRPLQKNSFYILHAALVILAAYYIETHYFRASVFGAKTLLLFVVFQFVSINVVTVLAYWVDKRAAVRGACACLKSIFIRWSFSAAGAGRCWPSACFATKRKNAAISRCSGLSC